jgi:hypothetical protein
MPTPHRFCFTLLTGTLLLGCGDIPSVAPVDHTGPSFSVDRASGPFFSLGFANEQYSVIVGATAENWAAFCATGEQTWDDWNILTVTRPDGSQMVTTRGGPNQHLLVWYSPTPIPPCAGPPDFTGTAHFLSHDSDVDLSSHGADASGQTVEGIVTDGSGQRYHFGANILLTVAPQYNTLDNFVIVFHSNKISLTPIGK